MITLTERAGAKVRELIENAPEAKGKSLRIALKPGGCSGWEYDFTFDSKRPDDHEIACGNFAVLLDPKSAGFLQNSRLDYSEELTGAGFKVENPNVKSSCGCGKSLTF